MRIKVTPAFAGILKAAFSVSTLSPLGGSERFVYLYLGAKNGCYVYAVSSNDGILCRFNATEYVEVETKGTGDAFVSKRLADFIASFGKELPEETYVETDDCETENELGVPCSKSKIRLIIDGDEAICLNQAQINRGILDATVDTEPELYHEFPTEEMTPVLERAVKCVEGGFNPTPAMTGVLFRVENVSMNVVACDGKRLFAADWELEIEDGKVPEQTEGIVPGRTLAKVIRLLRGDETGVAICSDAVYLTSGIVDIRLQVVNARYPNVRNILAAEGERRAVLPAKELLKASRRVNLVNDGHKISVLTYSFASGCVTARANTDEFGESSQSVFCQYSKTPITIRFSNNLILDYLESCGDENVQAFFNENCPVKFVDSLGTTVIMPLANQ
jgi:DNA polymerase III sliding clamp (beta) subunit (PCNA family)